MPVPAVLQNYKPVTAERLLKPEDSDVLMIRRTYDGWGYSPLESDHPANVARLQPVWSFATGQVSGHEATPLVNNGVMFVSTPGNQVIAHRREDGPLLWRYTNPPPPDVINLHRTSRGVALYGDKVFFARARGGARRARREDRQGSLVRDRRGQQARATTSRWRRSSPTAR